jgi:hypothetical protein
MQIQSTMVSIVTLDIFNYLHIQLKSTLTTPPLPPPPEQNQIKLMTID